MLIECLRQAASTYRPHSLSSSFPVSLYDPLLRLLLDEDPDLRLEVLQIVQQLLDHHGNLKKIAIILRNFYKPILMRQNFQSPLIKQNFVLGLANTDYNCSQTQNPTTDFITVYYKNINVLTSSLLCVFAL